MLDVVEFDAQEKPLGSIIWLHGLGASGDDFAPVAPHMQLPDVRFVFPHAPVRPVTLNAGFEMRAWYDITTLEESPFREPLQDVLEAEKLIVELIDAEIARGIKPQNIVLMGFSQGAAMALHVGHRYTQPLLGVIVMSGYLLHPQFFASEMSPANVETPFLFYHGSRDLTVHSRRGRSAYDLVREHHPHTRWKDYPVGHEVCLEQLRQIRFWLHNRYAHLRDTVASEKPS